MARDGHGEIFKRHPQFCMFSSVVHAEFCWICGLFPQYARARIFQREDVLKLEYIQPNQTGLGGF